MRIDEMTRKDLLTAIKPAAPAGQSDKFSRNLYYFIKRKAKPPFDRVICEQIASPLADHSLRLFYGEHGRPDIYVGFVDDEGVLHGVRLHTILTGGDTTAYCHLPRRGDPIDVTEWFWAEYLTYGRCFLHPDHSDFIVNGEMRWSYEDGYTRVCDWCGQVQTFETWPTRASGWQNQPVSVGL